MSKRVFSSRPNVEVCVRSLLYLCQFTGVSVSGHWWINICVRSLVGQYLCQVTVCLCVRSLVALSLILSLLLFKPAPLYILDEVDAALDLSHTQNIGQMLKAHFRHSQVTSSLVECS